jgi:hypothetical protein
MTRATLDGYPGATHRITDTYKEQLNEDLLAFSREQPKARPSSVTEGAGLMPIIHTACVTLKAHQRGRARLCRSSV